MTRYKVSYANQQDEGDLRKLLRKNSLAGGIEMLLLREPDFFRSVQVQGQDVKTLCIRDMKTNSLAGLATKAMKPVFINGQETKIGYLGNLRIASDYRNGTLLASGYKYLEKSRCNDDARLFLSTIIEDNNDTRAILESGRCSLPSYRDIGRYCVLVMGTHRSKKVNIPADCQVRRASKSDVPLIVRFLNKEGASKQFFPVYRQEDILHSNGILTGLQAEDIFMGFSGGELVATAAVWNQNDYKQSVVAGYNNHVRYTRHVVNAIAKILGYPSFPSPGKTLDHSSLTMLCAKENSDLILESLIECIRQHCKKNNHVLLAGLHERDPMLSVLKRYRHVIYSSRMYVVHWEDGLGEFQQLDGRVPYLELGGM